MNTYFIIISFKFILISQTIFASDIGKNFSLNINEKRNEYNDVVNRVHSISAKLNSLEKDYTAKSEKYKDLDLKYLMTEEKIGKAQEFQKLYGDEYNRIEIISEKLEREYLLFELAGHDENDLIAQKKITSLHSLLKEKRIYIKNKISEIDSLIQRLYTDRQDIKSQQEILSQILFEIEDEKRSKLVEQISLVEVKDTINSEINKIKALNKSNLLLSKNESRMPSELNKSTIPNDTLPLILKKFKFIYPVSNYNSKSIQKNGIEFKVKGNNSLLASENGKVAYVGNLSTYGTIIILDHGDQVRSVYLGEYESHVQSGDSIKKGDAIARVSVSSDNEKLDFAKIYFEIREKNKQFQLNKLIKI
jgi:murein DD-endopeptidase MepM/ murein hydrolase activator NlpD